MEAIRLSIYLSLSLGILMVIILYGKEREGEMEFSERMGVAARSNSAKIMVDERNKQ